MYEIIQAMAPTALQVIPEQGNGSDPCLEGHELLAIVDSFSYRNFILKTL